MPRRAAASPARRAASPAKRSPASSPAAAPSTKLPGASTVVWIYMVGFAFACFSQLPGSPMQAYLGRGAYWGYNITPGSVMMAGWQNEIAIWNAAVTIMLASLLQGGVDAALCLPSLAAMSLLFAANHAYGLFMVLSSGDSWHSACTNVGGIALNLLGLLCIISCWASDHAVRLLERQQRNK
jgi:hypothetical protein